MKSFFTLFICCIVFTNVIAHDMDITELGAISDGKTLCTEIIQNAIDDCSISGGGKVVVPAGKFLTGTLFLRNNVNLHLKSGAVLLGSTRIEDYLPDVLIKSQDAENISITGFGTIDGQGSSFWIPADRNKIPYDRAPQWIHKQPRSGNLIRLSGCKNVTIENVLLTGSESWTLHLLGCDFVTVTGIKIRNPLHGPNTDGIDIQACKNVIISNCDIYTRDDAICLKNRNSKYPDRDCENIIITNCIITTVCNAFKIGTETMGNFRNIIFSNSIVNAAKPSDELAKEAATWIDTTKQKSGIGPSGGITIATVDGAHIQNININNIIMNGVWTPIFIRLANRGVGAQKAFPPVPGTLKDVKISNIIAYGASSASSVTAIPGYYVENVTLDNITIKTQGGGDERMAKIELDENITKYPDPKTWKEMPVSGFFIRHVKGLRINNLNIIVEENDMRPLLKFDDVIDLHLNNLQTNDAHFGDCIMEFNNVRRARLLNIDFPQSKNPWIYFEGSETENIIIRSIVNLENKNLLKFDKSLKLNEIQLFD